MNKIFKVIWNHSLQCFVVVSELSKSKGKSSSNTDKRVSLVKNTIALAVAGGAVIGGEALAAVVTYNVESGKIENKWDYRPVAIGSGSEALGNSSVAIGSSAKTRMLSELSNSRAASEGRLIVTDWRSIARKNDNGQPMDSDQTTSSVFGGRAATYGQQATAIGESAEAVIFSTATGQNAKAMGYASVATGQDSQALDRWSVAVGVRANARGEYSSSLGGQANATKWGSTALGTYTVANGDEGTAVGYHADVTGRDGTASGAQSLAAEKATATGAQAKAEGTNATATGFQANASAANAVAAGVNSTASGESAVAVGRNTVASKAGTVAVGNEADATGDFSTAMGHDALASGNKALALGADAEAKIEKSVALGADSIVKDDPITTRDKSIGSFTYNFDGNTAISTISVGNDNLKRTITNLAAGRIEADSTDAINGSQLYAVAKALGGEVESIYFHTNTNTNQGAGDPATNKGKISDKAGATGRYAVTGGVNAKATGEKGTAIGYNAISTGSAVVIGANASSSSVNGSPSNGAVVIGENANAKADSGSQPASIAIGSGASASGIYVSPITMRNGSTENIGTAIAIGEQAKAIAASLAIGEAADAGLGQFATAVGTDARALGDRSTAVGVSTRATAQQAVASGWNANASGTASLSLGTNSTSSGTNSVAISGMSSASGHQSIALGFFSNAVGTNSIALGREAGATGVQAAALTSYAKALAKDSIAAGISAKTSEDALRGVAIARESSVTATDGIAMGYKTSVSGAESIAIGNTSTVSGKQSIAVGVGHTIAANNSGAFGDPNIIKAGADGSYAFGNDNTITTANTFVLGSGINRNDGVMFDGRGTVANSVYLGNESEVTNGQGAVNGSGFGDLKTLDKNQRTGTASTAGDTGTVETAKVGSLTYGSFAGAKSDGAVSVGSSGAERRIQNVAAGEISRTSTDAINGSQLYAVAHQASKAITFAANSNKDTVNSTMSYGAEDGLERILGEKIDIKGANSGLQLSRNADAATEGKYSARNVQTVVDDSGVQIQIAENPIFTNVQLGSNAGPKITNDGDSIKVGTANGTPTKITNVANGTNPNDAVNLSQLNAAKTKVIAGKNISSVNEVTLADGSKQYKIDAEDTTAKVAIEPNSALRVTPTVASGDKTVTTYELGLNLDSATMEVNADGKLASKAVEKVKQDTSTDNIAEVTPATGTDAYGKAGTEYTVKVSKEAVKTAAKEAIEVVGDAKAITVDKKDVGGVETFTVNYNGAEAAKTTPLTYKANGANPQTVNLSEGLNFTNGDKTVASVDANGVVKFDLNADAKAQLAKEESVSTSTPELLTVTKDKLNDTKGQNYNVDVKKGTFNAQTNNGALGDVTNTNGVATVADVVSAVNAGYWTAKVDDAEHAKVKFGDSINFVNGAATDATTKNGGITFDVKVDDNTIKIDQATNSLKVNTDALPKTVVAQGNNTVVSSNTVGTTTTYTVDAEKTTVSKVATSPITVTEGTKSASGVTNYEVGLSIDENTLEVVDGKLKSKVVDTDTDKSAHVKAADGSLVTVTKADTTRPDGITQVTDYTVDVKKGTFNNPSTTGELAAGNTGVATVADVVEAVNKGFLTTKVGGNQVERVGFGDDINFVNGAGTTARIVDGANGDKGITFDANLVSSDNSITIADKDGAKNLTVNTGVSTVEGGKAVTTDGDQVAKLGDVVETINNTSWKVNSTAKTGGEGTYTANDESKINAGDTLNIDAGKNIKISGAGNTLLVETKDDVTFDEVTTRNLTATGDTVVKNFTVQPQSTINMGNNQIKGVAEGTDNTDAVNVKQLKDTVEAAKAVEKVTAGTSADNIATVETKSGKTAGEANEEYVVSVSKAAVKTAAQEAIDVVGDGKAITVTNTTANGVETFTVKYNGAEAAETTPLTYKANGANPQTVNLSDGLDFTNGDKTVATVGANGEVSFDLSKEAKEQLAKEESVSTSTPELLTVTKDKLNDTKGQNYNVNVKKGEFATTTNAGKLATTTTDGVATVANVIAAVNAGYWTANVDGKTEVSKVKFGDSLNFVDGEATDAVLKDGGVSFNVKTDGSTIKVDDKGNLTVNTDGLSKTVVAEGSNVKVKADTQGTTTTYTVHADKSVVAPTAGTTSVTVTPSEQVDQTTGSKTTTYNVDLSAETKAQIAKVETVVAGDTGLVTVDNTAQNKSGGTEFKVDIAKGTFNNPTTTGALAAGNVGLATVADVVSAVNAGFLTTKVGGNQVEQVGFGDDINFVDGKGTTARVVDGANGDKGITFDANLVSSDNSITIADKDGAKNLTVNTGDSTVEDGGKATTTDGDQVAKLGDVVETINNTSWKVNSTAQTGGEGTYTENDESKINAGDTLNINAGKNIKISGAGNTLLVETKDDVTFDEVTTRNLTATGDTVVKNFTVQPQSTINMGNNQIKGVAEGTDNTDAVNVKQLKDTVEAAKAVEKVTADTSADNIATVETKSGKTAGEANEEYVVSVSKAAVKTAAQEAIDVVGDGKAITVTNTTANGVETFTVNYNGAEAAKTTPLTYKANGANPQTVNLSEGLDFTNGDKTVATVGANGEVSFDLSKEAKEQLAKEESVSTSTPELLTVTKDKLNDTKGQNYNVDVKKGTFNAQTNNGALGDVTNTNGVATVADVVSAVNAGYWTANVDGKTEVSKVKFGDSLNFVDGTATDAVLKDGGVSFNVKTDGTTIKVVDGNLTVNTDGLPKTKLADGKNTTVEGDGTEASPYKVNALKTTVAPAANGKVEVTGGTADENGVINYTVGLDTATKNIIDNAVVDVVDTDTVDLTKTGDTIKADVKTTTLTAIEAGKDNAGQVNMPATDDAKKLVNANDLAKVINASGWNVQGGTVDGGVAKGKHETTLINPGETVTLRAGKNLALDQATDVFTYSLQDDITVNNVTTSNLTATGTTTVNDFKVAPNSAVDMGNNNITNVAAGVADTDAVNVKQLNDTVKANKTVVEAGDNVEITGDGSKDKPYTINAKDTTATASVKNGSSEFLTVTANGTATASGTTTTDYAVGLTDKAKEVLNNAVTKVEDTHTVNLTKTGDTIKADVIAVDGKGTTANVTSNGLTFDIKADGNTITFDKNGSLTVNTTNLPKTKLANGKNTTVEGTGTDADPYKVNVQGDLANITSISNGDTTIKLGDATVNVGGATITNVANGTKAGDAVNYEQLQASQEEVVSTDKSVTITEGKTANGAKKFDLSVTTDGTTIIKGTNGELKVSTTDLTNTPEGKVNVPMGAEANKLATASDIATAINDSGFTVKANGDAGELVNPGDVVEFKNGKNINITRDGSVFTVKTVDTPVFTSVQFNANGPIIKADASNNINVGKADGSATKITNVAEGTADNDAVNVKQLKDTIAANKTEIKAGDNVNITGEGSKDKPYVINAKDTTATASVKAGSSEFLTVTANGTVTASGTTTTDYAVGLTDKAKEVLNNAATKVEDTHTVNLTKTGDTIKADVIATDGKGTTANVTSKGLTFDVKADGDTITFDKNGSLTVNTTNLPKNKLANGKNTTVTGKGSEADPYKVNVEGDLKDISSISNGNTTIKLGDATVNVGGATISNVKAGEKDTDAVNVSQLNETNQGWTITTSGNTDSKGVSSQVKLGKSAKPAEKTVTISGGKNIKVKQEGNTVTVATSDTPTFEKVTVGGENGVTVSSTTAKDGVKELSVGQPKAETRITNVAPGVKDTDAVNVSQLKQVQGNINAVNRKVDKLDKRVRGIGASSAAASSLPQVYIPGKSMVAAAAGGYGGASAVAVGYSRASDNGKVILKLQGTANSQGHVSGGVGVGYQW